VNRYTTKGGASLLLVFSAFVIMCAAVAFGFEAIHGHTQDVGRTVALGLEVFFAADLVDRY
jgi:hypothetical protein